MTPTVFHFEQLEPHVSCAYLLGIARSSSSEHDLAVTGSLVRGKLNPKLEQTPILTPIRTNITALYCTADHTTAGANAKQRRSGNLAQWGHYGSFARRLISVLPFNVRSNLQI